MPKFREFMGFVRHVVEHLDNDVATQAQAMAFEYDRLWDEIDKLWSEVNRLRGKPLPARPGGRLPKVSRHARRALPLISNWLEDALISVLELDSPRQSGIQLANELVKLVSRLAGPFEEQRRYLLLHEPTLRDAAMDSKWPRTVKTQRLFVADSLAGAEWKLTAPTSREYVRQARGKTAQTAAFQLRAIMDGKWWEHTS